MSLLDNLPHTATVDRPIYANDHYGAARETRQAVVGADDALACWAQPASAREILEFQRRNQAVEAKIYFNADPNLIPGDILTISGGQYDGQAMKFVAYGPATAGLNLAWKAMAARERSGTNQTTDWDSP